MATKKYKRGLDELDFSRMVREADQGFDWFLSKYDYTEDLTKLLRKEFMNAMLALQEDDYLYNVGGGFTNTRGINNTTGDFDPLGIVASYIGNVIRNLPIYKSAQSEDWKGISTVQLLFKDALFNGASTNVEYFLNLDPLGSDNKRALKLRSLAFLDAITTVKSKLADYDLEEDELNKWNNKLGEAAKALTDGTLSDNEYYAVYNATGLSNLNDLFATSIEQLETPTPTLLEPEKVLEPPSEPPTKAEVPTVAPLRKLLVSNDDKITQYLNTHYRPSKIHYHINYNDCKVSLSQTDMDKYIARIRRMNSAQLIYAINDILGNIQVDSNKHKLPTTSKYLAKLGFYLGLNYLENLKYSGFILLLLASRLNQLDGFRKQNNIIYNNTSIGLLYIPNSYNNNNKQRNRGWVYNTSTGEISDVPLSKIWYFRQLVKNKLGIKKLGGKLMRFYNSGGRLIRYCQEGAELWKRAYLSLNYGDNPLDLGKTKGKGSSRNKNVIGYPTGTTEESFNLFLNYINSGKLQEDVKSYFDSWIQNHENGSIDTFINDYNKDVDTLREKSLKKGNSKRGEQGWKDFVITFDRVYPSRSSNYNEATGTLGFLSDLGDIYGPTNYLRAPAAFDSEDTAKGYRSIPITINGLSVTVFVDNDGKLKILPSAELSANNQETDQKKSTGLGPDTVNETPGKERSTELTMPSESTAGSLLKLGILNAIGLADALNTNRLNKNDLLDAELPAFENPIVILSPIRGAQDVVLEARAESALFTNSMDLPYTSDASIALASKLDAVNLRNLVMRKAILDNNTEIRRTADIALKDRETSINSANTTANKNREADIASGKNRAIYKGQERTANYTSRQSVYDFYTKQELKNIQDKKEELDAIKKYIAEDAAESWYISKMLAAKDAYTEYLKSSNGSTPWPYLVQYQKAIALATRMKNAKIAERLYNIGNPYTLAQYDNFNWAVI